MIKVLANDGITPYGKQILQDNGFAVDDNHLEPEELAERINDYDALLVRSATKVRKDLIEQTTNLKLIGRGGVGLDNIDVDFARSKGIEVVNTPAASSQSVAELVIAHMFTGARFLHDANRKMPVEGSTNFKGLKKSYSKGMELRGKNLGILGFGRIGQAVARMALGLGMNVIPYDKIYKKTVSIEIESVRIKNASIVIKSGIHPLDELLEHSDFITLHIPSGDKPFLVKEHFDKMKDGVKLINAARGGVVDEDALLNALNSGKVSFAGIDVYDNEPTPREDLLSHPNVSVTPHIGASTEEAQERVWEEMAFQLMEYFENR